MKISIFTPTHDTRYLMDLYNSIKEQDFYEWVILYNNGAKPIEFNDDRVRNFTLGFNSQFVGTLKANACDRTTGDILVEVDHDDLLTNNCIAEIKKAFKDPEIGFVYSNTIHSDIKFNKIERFNEIYGWQYREVNFQGHLLDEHISFAPEPSSISKIWFAPNHVRAFRKNVYDSVGGYNREMRILDDLDLMCRLYQVTKFKHINKGLYVYRVHGENTWLKFNDEIQKNVFRIHDQYFESLCLRWSELNNLKALDLGGRLNTPEKYTIVDLKDADITCDLNKKWPFENNSVGLIRAYDVFEHLKSNLHTMKELYRVLVPSGYAVIQVPSTDGRGAFQDPTHISFWNENSFLYYTDQNLSKYIDTPVRFQNLRLYTTSKNNMQVCWTVAHLLKLSGDQRHSGQILI